MDTDANEAGFSSTEVFVFNDGARTLGDTPNHNGEVLIRGFNFSHGTPARWFNQNWWILEEKPGSGEMFHDGGVDHGSLVWSKLNLEQYRVANLRHGRLLYRNATGYEFRWYERDAFQH
jgi:hypothetical protein